MELNTERIFTQSIRTEKDQFVLLWGDYEYEIAFDRLETPEQLLGWVFNLSEKNWMDGRKIREFIHVVSKKNGFNIHGM